MIRTNMSIHKLIIKPYSAKTLCGLNVVALYPQTMYAMGNEAGQSNFKVTMDKGITCPACKKKSKE